MHLVRVGEPRCAVQNSRGNAMPGLLPARDSQTLSIHAEHPLVERKLPGTKAQVQMPVPKVVLDAGSRAATEFMRFFTRIENPHTRTAYLRDCLLFSGTPFARMVGICALCH